MIVISVSFWPAPVGPSLKIVKEKNLLGFLWKLDTRDDNTHLISSKSLHFVQLIQGKTLKHALKGMHKISSSENYVLGKNIGMFSNLEFLSGNIGKMLQKIN